MIQIQLLNNNATVPTKGSEEAAGLDLYATGDFTVYPDESVKHDLGFAMRIPKGFVALVMPRSGLAVKAGIDTGAGVIDSDYRGQVAVCLFNHTVKVKSFKKGDRIAQMVIQRHSSDMPLMVVDELSESVRGASGFGGSGE